MFDDVSPVKKAAYFMIFMFMVGLLVFWKAYYPYIRLQALIASNDFQTTAIVVEAKEPVKEDYYYYGPIVEFTAEGGIRVRSECISTLKTPTVFKEGEKVTICYDGQINTDVVIISDDAPRRRCIILCILGGVIAGIGLIDFVVHAVTASRTPKGKTVKFASTPDGRSYKEWREEQKLLEAVPPEKADTDEQGV